jgi:hypothetical protein
MKNLLIILYLILYVHGCGEQTEKTDNGNSLQLSKAMSDDVDGNFEKAIVEEKIYLSRRSRTASRIQDRVVVLYG